jgi:protoporphyrinogen oxidase
MGKKVCIVGGGCAGLTAAYTLHKNGYDVKVIEALPKVGGRMTSYKREGFCVDEAAQMVHPGYRVAREVMKEVGLYEELVEANLAGIKLWFNDDWMDPGAEPDNPEEFAKKQDWLEFMGPENFGRFVGWVEQHAKDKVYEGSVDWMLELDKMTVSFGEYVKKEFGEGVLEGFAMPVFAALGLEQPEKTGVGFGVQIMWTVLCGEAAVVKYGLGNLAERIVDELGPERVVAGVPVKRILVENNKVMGIETDEGVIEADTVICATPAEKTLQIIPDLPDAMTSALSRVTYCPTIHVSIFVDKEMSDGNTIGGLLPRYTGSPFCSVLFQSARSKWMVPEGKDSISVFFYSDGCREYYDKTDEEITDATVKLLQKYFSQMPDDILFSHVVKVYNANYTMQNGCATGMKYMRENHYKDVEGLYLCGEYMFTGSYESAINAGRRAARVVMGELENV